jgi:hypothetical protein
MRLDVGAPTAVSPLLRRLDESLGATHLLTDNHGIDVVTGEDRSALLNARVPPSVRRDRATTSWSSSRRPMDAFG